MPAGEEIGIGPGCAVEELAEDHALLLERGVNSDSPDRMLAKSRRGGRFRTALIGSIGRSGTRSPTSPTTVVKAFGSLPIDSSAKVRIAAVTPEPQEVMIGLSRSTPADRERRFDVFARRETAVLEQPARRAR